MKKFDPKHYPYMAASIQAVQYGHAGFVYLSWVGLVTAGLLGVLISFGMALASSKISDIAKKRKPGAWVSFLLLALISPAFVGVAMWIALDVITIPLWRVVVAALWGLIPDGSVALVGFIAGKGMVAADEKPAIKRTKPAVQQEQPAYVCSNCDPGRSFGSQSALNAHQRSHKPIKIDTSLLIKKDGTK